MSSLITLREGNLQLMKGTSECSHFEASSPEEDVQCKKKLHVASTNSMTSRWANTKLRCNARDSDITGYMNILGVDAQTMMAKKRKMSSLV